MKKIGAFGLLSLLATVFSMRVQAQPGFDWQGHRGARGLAPENTVPAFLKALEFPRITTLEMDLAVSSDLKLIVSHDPWMSALICSHPDGRPVGEDEEASELLYGKTQAQIKKYDCGRRGNPRFPAQKPMDAHKPTLGEVVRAVEKHVRQKGLPRPGFNIEIKSRPEWDGVQTPPVAVFARLVAEAVKKLRIQDRVCIQSFDPRALREVHARAPELTLALLVENKDGIEANLGRLGFIPRIYSPHYELLDAESVRTLHERGMRVIPWTVNDTQAMKALVALGVDGIITDYPDRIPE